MWLVATIYALSGNTYVVEYDPVTGEPVTQHVDGTAPLDLTITEAELGYPNNSLRYAKCFEGNKHWIYMITSYPFMYVTIDYNVAECGYIAPPPGGVCDLAIGSINTTPEVYIGSTNGTMQINATSGNGNIQYSLDNVNWQLNNNFVGLVKGTYVVYLKDAGGCLAQQTVEVLRTYETPPPTSSTGFPWAEKICHFFKLGIEGVLHDVREPAKWDSVGIVGERDKDWHGWNYQYSDGEVQLEFDCPAGKDLIEEQYALHGSDAEVDFIYGFTYNGEDFILFEGKLNFNTRRALHNKVALSVESKSFNDLLQTRFDTLFSMKATETHDGDPITPPQAFDIQLHSKQFLSRYSNVVATAPQTSAYSPEADNGIMYFFLPMDTPLINEITEYFPAAMEVSLLDPTTVARYYWKLQFPGTVSYTTLQANLHAQLRRVEGSFPSDEAYTIKPWFKIYRGGAVIHSYQIGATVNGMWNDISGQEIQNKTIVFTGAGLPASFALEKDDEIYIYAEYLSSNEGRHYAKLSATDVDIKASSLENASASTSKMWLLFDVIDHLVKGATNNGAILKSNLLALQGGAVAKDGEFALYANTNGFNIRNFDAEEKPLKLSLKTALNSTKAIAAIGFGVESAGDVDMLRVEKVEHFYQDKEIIVIAPNYDAAGKNDKNIESYEEETWKEGIWNEIEIGYNKFKAEGYNTLDEFNTRHEYLTPIKTHKQKFIAKSDFIASGYSIEDVRRQQYVETPTDSYEHDDAPFIIALRRNAGSFAAEKNEPFDTVTGVISPETSYNLRITPLRNLLNWGKWLSGSFAFKAVTELIKNTFVDKNGELTTQFNAAEPNPMGDVDKLLLQEKQNVTVEQLNSGTYLTRPEWAKIKCRLTPDKVLLINEALRGKSDNTKNYGYITVQRPQGDFVAVYPYKLTYNFGTERCQIEGVKAFNNPVDPTIDCCNWLNINGCQVLINGEKIILNN